MAENRLGVGRISWPSGIDKDLLIALEDLTFRLDDTIDYLIKPMVVTATTNYTASDLDAVILADASGGIFNVTLPDATITKGKKITVKRISASNTVTVVGTIDGSSNYALDADNKFITVVSNGTDWHIIAQT